MSIKYDKNDYEYSRPTVLLKVCEKTVVVYFKVPHYINVAA
jgi:hypothetical protein